MPRPYFRCVLAPWVVPGPGGVLPCGSGVKRPIRPRNCTGVPQRRAHQLSTGRVRYGRFHSPATRPHRDEPATPRTVQAMAHRWDPRCRGRRGWSAPSRSTRQGSTGPTEDQARGEAGGRHRWGMYVPSDVDGDVVEQRIVEQAGRIKSYGAVTAWAALRWHGGHFFDGTSDAAGSGSLFRSSSHSKLRPDPRFTLTEEQLSHHGVVVGGRAARGDRPTWPFSTRYGGSSERAREGQRDLHGRGRSAHLRPAVQHVRRPPRAVDRHPGRARRRPPRRRRLSLAAGVPDVPHAGVLDAEFPIPLLNREVYDLDGQPHRDPRPLRRGGRARRRVPGRGSQGREAPPRRRGAGGEVPRPRLGVLRGRRRGPRSPSARRSTACATLGRAPSSFRPSRGPGHWNHRPGGTPPETVHEYLVRTGRADQLWRT